VASRNGGSGTAGLGVKEIKLRLPVELVVGIIWVQKGTRSASFNETCRRLLESHPELTKALDDLYSEMDTSPHPG
jgi:hypothetical protein